MDTSIGITELRQDIYRVVKSIEDGDKPFVTIKHGRLAVAALVPVDSDGRPVLPARRRRRGRTS